MAQTGIQRRAFKPARVLRAEWDSVRRGLDVMLRDSELNPESARELTNLFIEGKGILTQRPGTGNYFQAGNLGKVRGLFGARFNDQSQLLAITDEGYLVRKSGTTHTQITGMSWASGQKVRMTQLQGKVWITQSEKPITRYDGTTLLSYITVSAPASLTATKISPASGPFTYSWRVATETDAGLTLASDPVVISNLPHADELSECPVRLSWVQPSTASGLVTGFTIFGRDQGSESRMTRVNSTTTTFVDDGTYTPSSIAQLPDFNETGGLQAKFNIKSSGKIVLANIKNYASRVQWSGADINVGKFHWTKGGGYIDIDRDDGTEITAIHEASENRIIVWKERATYQIKLNYNADLGVVEPDVQKITDSIGCLSQDTVLTAENDIYFLGRRAGGGVSLNSLGYQANILANVLRTAELSPQVRPILETVNVARGEDMFALFYDQKYYLFYPSGNATNCLVFDFERKSFTGPHSFPGNPVVGTVYYDDNNQEHLLYGDGDDGYVTEISKNYDGDKGVPFAWSYLSRNENFGFNFRLKTLLKAMVHLANVSGGTVNVQIYTTDRSGNSVAQTNFTVEEVNKLAGWGSFPWARGVRWGSMQQASTSTTNTSEVRKVLDLNTSGIVSAQIRISSSNGAKARIVELGMTARPEAEQNIPSEWMATV